MPVDRVDGRSARLIFMPNLSNSPSMQRAPGRVSRALSGQGDRCLTLAAPGRVNAAYQRSRKP